MKKILAGILTLALAASMGVTAFADSSSQIKGYGSTTITPRGVVETAGEPAVKVSADITWDELTFVYKDGGKQWNPATHADETIPGGWDTGKKTITVTNHSNTGIRANISFAPTVEGIVGAFEGSTEMMLDSAVGTARDSAPQGSVQFGISGAKITDTTATKIGTLTVKVATQSGEPIYKTVNTMDELKAAVSDGVEYIRLGNSIDFTSSSPLSVNQNCTVDLNGRTITVMALSSNSALFEVSPSVSFCLKNGTVALSEQCRTVSSIALKKGCTLSVESCTLDARDAMALDIYDSNVSIKDSTINYISAQYPDRDVILVESGSLTLSGRVMINGNESIGKWDGGTVSVLPGSYNFDPTDYVDGTAYDVAGSGGTWTVTKK